MTMRCDVIHIREILAGSFTVGKFYEFKTLSNGTRLLKDDWGKWRDEGRSLFSFCDDSQFVQVESAKHWLSAFK